MPGYERMNIHEAGTKSLSLEGQSQGPGGSVQRGRSTNTCHQPCSGSRQRPRFGSMDPSRKIRPSTASLPSIRCSSNGYVMHGTSFSDPSQIRPRSVKALGAPMCDGSRGHPAYDAIDHRNPLSNKVQPSEARPRDHWSACETSTNMQRMNYF